MRQAYGRGALALEFLIVTAARTGEVLGMTWDEIDLDNKLWTLPPHRTKQGREHQVPLCDRAMQILAIQKQYMSPGSPYVFNGYKRTRLAEKTMASVLQSMGVNVTVHGFRSTFRDWAGNETEFPREHVEECLGHLMGNKVERAYRRRPGIEKRRAILEAWEQFCGSKGATHG